MESIRVIYYLAILGLPLVAGLGWWWWADRRLRGLPYNWGWRLLMGVFVVVFSVCYLWLLGTRWMGVAWTPHSWILAYMMLWGLIFLPFVALPSMGLWTIWRGGGWLMRRVRRWVRKADVPEVVESAMLPSDRMTRRQMMTTAAVTLPMLATLGTTAVSIPQKRRFQITEYTLRFDDLPAALDGMTIAHLSDTHVGKFTRGRILDRIADATNDLAADLVLITGDVIDNTLHDLPEALRMIDRIDPRSGLFVCEGNHDLFDGRENFREAVREHGTPLLVDEAQTVRVHGERVQLMGIAWHGRGKPIAPHVDRAVARRDHDAFPILLAHHPDAFDRATEHRIPLTLAGHTHGGQLMLNDGFGAGPLMFKYWTGLYEKDRSKLIVSNGAGNWFPLRTNAPAEIVHITLKKA
ncbi:metallophosphoesterase [Phycisphaerales bacterium AB-hyl4]|uniref:Metallophosphoesterase n=1 Tax=Natronomicrosphaera hydrolytica TaxID=3242702 RepID=A0ABV4U0Q2_9BACT